MSMITCRSNPIPDTFTPPELETSAADILPDLPISATSYCSGIQACFNSCPHVDPGVNHAEMVFDVVYKSVTSRVLLLSLSADLWDIFPLSGRYLTIEVCRIEDIVFYLR
jgi:hypothetical protein